MQTDHQTLIGVREMLESGDVEGAKRLIDEHLKFKQKVIEAHRASVRA